MNVFSIRTAAHCFCEGSMAHGLDYCFEANRIIWSFHLFLFMPFDFARSMMQEYTTHQHFCLALWTPKTCNIFNSWRWSHVFKGFSSPFTEKTQIVILVSLLIFLITFFFSFFPRANKNSPDVVRYQIYSVRIPKERVELYKKKRYFRPYHNPVTSSGYQKIKQQGTLDHGTSHL